MAPPAVARLAIVWSSAARAGAGTSLPHTGEDRPRPAGAAPGNPAPGRGPAGAVARRGVPGRAQPPQDQAPPGSPPAALTRLALAGSGDTGRPGWAESAPPINRSPHARRRDLTPYPAPLLSSG
jgi:hypothetical protein